jgi:hypothetical protein
MGVHLPAFNSEELASADVLSCQLCCASSAVSILFHTLFIYSSTL